MARTESDREDLMEEAVALKQRVEFSLPGESDLVVAGFRVAGEFSIYFGDDAAFHFDSQGRLRRAFTDGLLYRTQGTTLARLRRERTPSKTELERHDLRANEVDAFLAELRKRLIAARTALGDGKAQTLRQVSNGENVLDLLSSKINEILTGGPLLAPAIRGKR